MREPRCTARLIGNKYREASTKPGSLLRVPPLKESVPGSTPDVQAALRVCDRMECSLVVRRCGQRETQSSHTDVSLTRVSS